jgi:uncharacterized protein DUF5990/bacteriocin resistance YdeI/OmpD-like protein
MRPRAVDTAPLELVVRIEHKHAGMPAFAVVPASDVAKWKLTATTTVEGTLDGHSMGRRSLKRWDDERWFIELRRDFLGAVGKSPGDRATLVITRASAALPAELQALVDADPEARRRWESRTEAQKRMLREEVLAVKSPAARERRVRRALLPVAEPPSPRIEGLTAEPRPVQVRILGRRLPGRNCGAYRDVSVGLAEKVGCDPTERVSADRREAKWETRIEVSERNGRAAFRGPAVNGPPGERFLYLTWIGRKGAAAPAMFRRAKLRLDAVPSEVLAASLRSGVLVGRLELTAADGMPVCASVRPPAITWKDS